MPFSNGKPPPTRPIQTDANYIALHIFLSTGSWVHPNNLPWQLLLGRCCCSSWPSKDLRSRPVVSQLVRISNLPSQSDRKTCKQSTASNNTHRTVIYLIIGFHSWRLERQKGPLQICPLHFLVETVMEAPRGKLQIWPVSLSLSAESMAYRQVVPTFHCFNVGCSILVMQLNSDNDS